MVIERIRTGRRPYRILFHPDGKSFFVTHWADGTLGHYDTVNGSQLARVPLGAHPTDMVWRAGATRKPVEGEPHVGRAPVRGGGQYQQRVRGGRQRRQGAARGGEHQRLHDAAPAAGHDAFGRWRSAPTASGCTWPARTPTRWRWWMSPARRSHVKGFIPTGWYPTAVRALPSGTLVVLNGKGVRSYPNPKRAQSRAAGPSRRSRIAGGCSTWPACRPARPRGSTPFTDAATGRVDHGPRWPIRPTATAKLDEPNPLPPIEHVIYIVKENRTYDQVLGDMKEGNGDPSLDAVRRKCHAQPAQAGARIRAAGQFLRQCRRQRRRPQLVHRRHRAGLRGEAVAERLCASAARTYDFEEQDPASLPPAGYLWTNATRPGVSIRNFGYMVDNKKGRAAGRRADHRRARPGAGQGDQPQVPRLRPGLLRTSSGRRSSCSELAEYEKTGNMPRLIVMRLPNDHTSATQPGEARSALRWPPTTTRRGHDRGGRFQIANSGPARRFSCWRTTRRTARTTWIRTARRRS